MRLARVHKRKRGLFFSSRGACSESVVHDARVDCEFQLIEMIMDADTVYEVIRFLPAAASVQLSRSSRTCHVLLTDPLTPQWCATSRRDLLLSRAVAGDLPLADVKNSEWTWERHH